MRIDDRAEFVRRGADPARASGRHPAAPPARRLARRDRNGVCLVAEVERTHARLRIGAGRSRCRQAARRAESSAPPYCNSRSAGSTNACPRPFARRAAGTPARPPAAFRAPRCRRRARCLRAARRSAPRETAAARARPTRGRARASTARSCGRASPTAAARATDSRRAACPGTRECGSKTHFGNRPGDSRTVQRAPVARSTNGYSGWVGPTQFVAGADRTRIIRASRDCPTAPGDCRCRWSRPASGRSTSGNGRPPAAPPHAARRCAPRRCNCTAAARPDEARADHMNETRHQKTLRATIHSRRERGLLTLVRGRSKPRSTVASSTQR